MDGLLTKRGTSRCVTQSNRGQFIEDSRSGGQLVSTTHRADFNSARRVLRLGRRPQPSERRSRREARPPSGAGQPQHFQGALGRQPVRRRQANTPRLPKGPRSGAEPAWLARDTRGRSPRMRGGRLHLGARSKVSGRAGAGMATPGRPACAWPACATSGNVESLESIRPKCVNQPDRPAWSWRMAHVRETGRCHTTRMWNF